MLCSNFAKKCIQSGSFKRFYFSRSINNNNNNIINNNSNDNNRCSLITKLGSSSIHSQSNLGQKLNNHKFESNSKQQQPFKQLDFGIQLTSTHPSKKRVSNQKKSDDEKQDKPFLKMSGFGVAQYIELHQLRFDLGAKFTQKLNLKVEFPTISPELLNETIIITSKEKPSNPAATTTSTDAAINQPDLVPWDIFVFSNGVIVFWNTPTMIITELMKFIIPYCKNPIDPSLIEEEELNYCFSNDKTCLIGEDIYLQNQISVQPDKPKTTDVNLMLFEKFAFSDALALSVKLSLLEDGFDTMASDFEPWIVNLKSGFVNKANELSVLKKVGELFTLKHLLNVSTSLIETPDFYWEHPEIEHLFQQLKSTLSISPRIKILNSRLDMCCQLTEILSNHLRFKHASRLELMIIALILVEIIFEAFHYYERHQERKQTDDRVE